MTRTTQSVCTFAAAVICMVSLATSDGETLSYPDIVNRMVDMQRLAVPPVEGEKSGSFSSRDRQSRYNEETGRYEHWQANHDYRGYVDDKGTMLKLDGPGVIWRIWSASAQKGNLEFYIDRYPDAADATPTAAYPFIDMIKAPPFSDYPELVHVKAKGNNFFVPIPFNKSIVIRGAKDWGKYYQITYSTFPDGTTVPSFTGTFSETDKAALKKVNDIWGKRGPAMFVSETAKATQKTVSLAPGNEAVVAGFDNPGAITSIVLVRPQMDRKESIKILRELTISITWDDNEKPAVWAPLGDFFGTAAGENLFRTMATGMTTDGYYANWYMPFRKAKIVVRNDGKKKRNLSFTVYTEKVKGYVDQLLRFHCKWHRDDFSGFDEKRHFDDRYPDWPVLKVDGSKGRFCGFMAHMWNPFHIWNREHGQKYEKQVPAEGLYPRGSAVYHFYKFSGAKKFWWGEGDEKFFVDGEKMPSTFGTGTEDYFGYAWGTAQAFDSALQAQPRNGAADEIGKIADRAGPGNVGHISNVRWQIADNVPFQKSFEATVEKYHLNSWPLLNAYCAAWYQEAGAADYYQAVAASERTGYYIAPTLKEPKKPVNGKFEGENLRVVLKGSGRTWVQNMHNFKDGKWSGGRHLIWTKGRKGDSVEIEFETTKGGKQELFVVLTKANDYGIAQLALDGKNVGKPIDCYSPKVTTTEEISLGTFDLQAGKHVLRATVVGTNEKARNAVGAGSHIFAIDYLRLK